MGQTILILGESGTGKSTSLRNFKSNEIKLIKTVSKNLPFKGRFDDCVISDQALTIVAEIKKATEKIIVIDDAQYIMSNEYFRRVKENGWDKFADIGSNFYKVLHAADDLPDDVFVYILSHLQKDETGTEKIKTIGKMLDEKLTIEGLCTVVLKTTVVDGVYSFQTQNSGHDTCKSPIGMFNNFLIDNDLKMVDSIIREYWGYTTTKVEEKEVSREAPTLKNPKVKATEEAKSRKLKEAPVVEQQSLDLDNLKESEKVVEVQEETKEVKNENNDDNKLNNIKAKLAAIKANQSTIQTTQHNEVKTDSNESKMSKIDEIKAKLAKLKESK